MIVPMKKICLLVQDKTQVEAMTKLREIGVVHLEKSNVATDGLSRVIEKKNRAESALGLIEGCKAPKKKSAAQERQGQRERRANTSGRRGRRAADIMGVEELEPYSLDAVNAPERPGLIDYMISVGKDYKPLQERLTFIGREKERIGGWGEFDPASVKEMAGLGLPVFLYELTPTAFAEIPKETRYIKVNEDKSVVRLLVLDSEIPAAVAFHLPEKSISALESEEKEVKSRINEIEEQVRKLADRRQALEKEMAAIQNDIDFEIARVSLQRVENISEEQSFSYLTGFIPEEDMDSLRKAAAENSWAFMAAEPGPEEQVPTKLRNSKFVQLLYPLTDFIDVTPDYRETDISVFFLIFFTVFYAMIFGDAGYGVILFLVTIALILKTAKTGVPVFFKLLLLLSSANIVWGVLTCSWFGIATEHLPQSLKDISLSYISPAKSEPDIINQNLQIFCFTLGLIHLTIARIKRLVINIGSLKALSEIGSLGMIWGMYNVVLFLVVSSADRSIPLLPVSIYAIAGGFALTFIFGSYEGNILKSILESLKNIISVVLSITGVFADIMSYIRLWAVGLAGATIAATVNTMAGPLLAGIMTLLGGIILLVAVHGINFVLGALGVLVHGVRLNTLEFSQHVGVVWAGVRYRPFALKK